MDDRTASWTPTGAEGGEGAPRPGMPVVGDVLAGRFLLTAILGRGGSGTVFAARDVKLGQKVAVKVLDPERLDASSLERLRREVHAARGGHPNTVTVYDLHEAGGLHFLSMDLVEGGSLRDRLENHGRLPVAEVIRIGAQVASALAHLHDRGIVHRDVKPGNILLTPDGTARLGDMGLARPLAQGLTVTETAMVVGTPAYMAPEQATGEELTPAADIYALGLTLHQALTGEVPLADATALSTLMRRQKERPPSVRRFVPEAPRWLARLLLRMLDPDPRERPTAIRVIQALSSERFSTLPRRRVLLAAGLILALATAIPLVHAHLRRNATVRFEVAENAVFGLDDHGRTTWKRPITSTRRSTVEADLNGDGYNELVVATALSEGPRGEVREYARLAAFNLQGHVVISVRLRDIVQRWSFPYPLLLFPEVQATDLDLDGRAELLVLCRQLHYYPTVILVYWPAKDQWQVPLEHPGYIRVVRGIPDTIHPTLRFAGVTNRPIMSPVAGQITLEPGAPQYGPERLQPTGIRTVPGASWDWYTILMPGNKWLLNSLTRLENSDDGGSVLIATDGSRVELDRWGNPVDGPNAGKDLRDSRLTFLAGLYRLKRWTPTSGSSNIAELAAPLRATTKPLFLEPSYQISLAIVTARAWARAGNLDRGIQVLEEILREHPSEDLTHRLAHLLALSGDLRGAIRVLEPVVSSPFSTRADFDCRLLLQRVAIESRDRELTDRCVLGVRPDFRKEPEQGSQTALRARAHLWWDDLSETDCQVRSWSYEPAGDALACLARWRLGRTLPEDPEAMRRGAQANPDSPFEFPIAEAAALIGLGRPADALVRLETLEPALRKASLDDFGNHQLLDLSRALHAVALARSGNVAQARAEAASLGDTLKPGLLPVILALEVLEGRWTE